MSAIALKWVSQISVGNQTAKQLLLFYASHNFGSDEYVFKNSTLSKQLEVTERAIQKAHLLLLEQKLIVSKKRFDENGRQMSNVVYLNIPQEFVDSYFNVQGEGERRSGGRVNDVRGEGERSASLLNNNKNNNKEEIKERVVSKRQCSKPFPDYFNFNDENISICLEYKLDICLEFKQFEKYYSNKRRSDWQKDFTLWLLRSAKYKKENSLKKQKFNPTEQAINNIINSQRQGAI